MQVATEAEPMAERLVEEKLKPAAEELADQFEAQAVRLAEAVGPVAEGLPRAIRRAVHNNKVSWGS